MTITLNTFVNAANRAATADRTLKVDGDRVRDVGHPTLASTNRATMAAFRDSLRAQFGDQAARVALEPLEKNRPAGKPLTAYEVKQTVASARQAELGEFVSGLRMDGTPITASIDANGNTVPACSLDGIIDAALAHQPNLRLGEDERHEIKSRLANEVLQTQFVGERSHSDEMFRVVSGSHTLVNLLCPLYRGSFADKCAVLDRVGGANAAFALQHLPQMRALQGEGALTRETLWRACFNEPLPPAQADADDAAFATAFATRRDAAFQTYVKTLPAEEQNAAGKPVRGLHASDALDRVVNAYGVTLETLAAPQGGRIEGTLATASISQHSDGTMDERIGRMLGESAGLQHSNGFSAAPLTISAPLPEGGEASVAISRQTVAQRAHGELANIVHDEDREAGSSTFQPNPGEADAATIAQTWRQTEAVLDSLNGDAPLPDVQRRAVVDAMSQNFNFVPRRLEAAAGVLVDPGNASYAIRLERQDDGDVLVHHVVSRRAGADAPFTPATGVTFRIHPDGKLDGEAPFFINASLHATPEETASQAPYSTPEAVDAVIDELLAHEEIPNPAEVRAGMSEKLRQSIVASVRFAIADEARKTIHVTPERARKIQKEVVGKFTSAYGIAAAFEKTRPADAEALKAIVLKADKPISAALIGVLPSIADHLPQDLLQSLASGVPTLASRAVEALERYSRGIGGDIMMQVTGGDAIGQEDIAYFGIYMTTLLLARLPNADEQSRISDALVAGDCVRLPWQRDMELVADGGEPGASRAQDRLDLLHGVRTTALDTIYRSDHDLGDASIGALTASHLPVIAPPARNEDLPLYFRSQLPGFKPLQTDIEELLANPHPIANMAERIKQEWSEDLFSHVGGAMQDFAAGKLSDTIFYKDIMRNQQVTVDGVSIPREGDKDQVMQKHLDQLARFVAEDDDASYGALPAALQNQVRFLASFCHQGAFKALVQYGGQAIHGDLNDPSRENKNPIGIGFAPVNQVRRFDISHEGGNIVIHAVFGNNVVNLASRRAIMLDENRSRMEVEATVAFSRDELARIANLDWSNEQVVNADPAYRLNISDVEACAAASFYRAQP